MKDHKDFAARDNICDQSTLLNAGYVEPYSEASFYTDKLNSFVRYLEG